MNPEQITQAIQQMLQEMTRLATNFENLIVQFKASNERIDRMVDHDKVRAKSQGERMGKLELEATAQAVNIEKILKNLESIETDVNDLKTKGSKRWDNIIEKVICVALGAIAMTILYRIGL